jgi:hypothetical protein
LCSGVGLILGRGLRAWVEKDVLTFETDYSDSDFKLK